VQLLQGIAQRASYDGMLLGCGYLHDLKGQEFCHDLLLSIASEPHMYRCSWKRCKMTLHSTIQWLVLALCTSRAERSFSCRSFGLMRIQFLHCLTTLLLPCEYCDLFCNDTHFLLYPYQNYGIPIHKFFGSCAIHEAYFSHCFYSCFCHCSRSFPKTFAQLLIADRTG